MNDKTTSFSEQLQAFQQQSAADQMRFWQDYVELWQRTLNGEVADQAVGNEYMQFYVEESSRYFRNLATLNTNYYNALVELTQSLSERVASYVVDVDEADGHQSAGKRK